MRIKLNTSSAVKIAVPAIAPRPIRGSAGSARDLDGGGGGLAAAWNLAK
jgi:hypothetical protein